MAANSTRLGMQRGRKLLPEYGTLSVRASQTFYPGSLVAHRFGSNLAEAIDPSAPRADLVIVGCATHYLATTSSVNGSSEALDADGNVLTIQYEAGLLKFFDTGSNANALTDASRGKPAFAYDNNTLYATDAGGTLSFAGIVHSVDTDEGVRLMIPTEGGGLTELYSQGAAAIGYTSDDTVRAVATSLPAGTFSGGVLTLTATGAFSTAQDGVTLAVGDKFIIPAGTITTLVVSAANSGVYEVTGLGGTGVSATFTRTAKWAHGALITPGTEIRVGGEGTIFHGTKWRAEPATAAKVVGTDDPLLFPERVTVAKTLSSGTATISTIPLRAAGKFGVYIDWTGGSPAATTTSIQASTQTPGGIGTASIVLQEQSVLGTLVNTGTATCNVTILQ